ncbi:MAG TPA: hypothetical protein VGG83_23335 [Trebonia sp.]
MANLYGVADQCDVADLYGVADQCDVADLLVASRRVSAAGSRSWR